MTFMEDTRENAESKVLLLFFADKVRMPVSSMQLTRIMLEHRFMNYFHMQQCLHELTDNHFLSLENREGTDFYSITPDGARILDLFRSLVPEGIRTRMLAGISEIRTGLMRETSVTADSLLVTEDEYQVTLRIAETDVPLFEMRLSVGSRDDARSICRNWRENANILYPRFITLLLSQISAQNEFPELESPGLEPPSLEPPGLEPPGQEPPGQEPAGPEPAEARFLRESDPPQET
jgi:predicted transcriptional regulator